MTSQAIIDIEVECANRIINGGWAPERDDALGNGIWANAAAVYAEYAQNDECHKFACDLAARGESPMGWPLPPLFYKPTDRREDLVKAGAWIVAEIEYLDRQAAKAKEAEAQS